MPIRTCSATWSPRSQRLAPEDAGWIHDIEGPDDMPAHVKAMLTGVSLHIPVSGGKMALGTWQGIYLVEHRAKPHRRMVLHAVHRKPPLTSGNRPSRLRHYGLSPGVENVVT